MTSYAQLMMDSDAKFSIPGDLPRSVPPHTTSMTPVRIFVDALKRMGVAYTTVLERCKIQPVLLDDPEQRLPESKVMLLWPTAADMTEDPHFGIHAGQRAHPQASSILAFLLMSSPTLRVGLERVVRFQSLMVGQKWIEIASEQSEIRVTLFPQAQWQWERHRVEMASMLLISYLNWISVVTIRPCEVRFHHVEAPPLDEYHRSFQCPVVFGAEKSCLVFTGAALDQPSRHSNPALLEMHERYAFNRLRQLEVGGVAEHVRSLLALMLEDGPKGLHELAYRMNISPRTLQRRLATENTSYNAILTEMRQELALSALERDDTPIVEIAYMTGFANPSAFSRAMHRWTGKTPLAYRSTHLRR